MTKPTPVHSAKATIMRINAFFCPLPGAPNDIDRTVNPAIVIASRARTTIAIGRTDVRATQTGAKSGRVNPTRMAPAINLTSKTDCSINCATVGLVPWPIDHSKNCSIPTLANWSDNVENASAAWQEVVEVVMFRFIKSTSAHKAAKIKNRRRTSLRPSCSMGPSWPLKWISSAPDAACSKMPLSYCQHIQT